MDYPDDPATKEEINLEEVEELVEDIDRYGNSLKLIRAKVDDVEMQLLRSNEVWQESYFVMYHDVAIDLNQPSENIIDEMQQEAAEIEWLL
ncbi:MAG TPA: hypothetical protein VJL89_12455 [Thermodesulfovibrionia bacterium]|nr:hypothetical protein [Thermodesulfovibrionia bacterium]